MICSVRCDYKGYRHYRIGIAYKSYAIVIDLEIPYLLVIATKLLANP